MRWNRRKEVSNSNEIGFKGGTDGHYFHQHSRKNKFHFQENGDFWNWEEDGKEERKKMFQSHEKEEESEEKRDFHFVIESIPSVKWSGNSFLNSFHASS